MSSDEAILDGPYVAVIGMAGRFPGARNVDEFWANLRDGVESIHFFTDEELLLAGESPTLLSDPAYVKAWPRLDDIDQFDAAFFGLSPRDAAIFDPQHRVFLETAWAAVENAGYVGERCPGPVGVFASCGFSEYMVKNVMTNPAVVESVGEWLIRHLGNDSNFLATRVSYQLNLRGPSLNVQTACSSSLVAIHLASQSLLNGECDLALAGGSTIYAEQNRGYMYKEGEILSPDGHCRAFDARSQGTTFGSATACVVLKRLADAIADGDNVLAVIRGSAINNDGSQKVGYLAPSVEGQARVVAEALALSGVDADEISYVETHGTGTLIGDPIEIAGLTQAFRATTQRKGYCAIGSVKPNVGHSGEAAGVTSFIKTVLSLVHRQLPPSILYEEPNPQAGFEESPFFVNARLTPWNPRGRRRAGVTGLGAGGTNAHVILEESPPLAPSGPHRPHQLLLLSARTEGALERATENLADHLEKNPSSNLGDVAHTLRLGRTAFAHRRTVVCESTADAVSVLRSRDPKRVSTQVVRGGGGSVVFMFPGGGAQYAGMGRDLYDAEPVYREAIETCLAHVKKKLGHDLRPLLFPRPEDTEAATKRLLAPSVALPALFTTAYALSRLLLSWNLTPSAMIGHSAGEYVAACLAGVFTLEAGLELVGTRGRLFETLAAGGMLSVSLPEAEARAFMGSELSFAAINGPNLCVLSGPVAAIAKVEEVLREKDIDCTRVHIDVAAHSSMLDPILPEFERFCRSLRFSAPKIPYISNLTGTWITEAEVKDPTYWVRHLRHTVRFADGMSTLLDEPNRVFVEVGPGRTLASLARQQPKKAGSVTPTLRHPKETSSDVAFLLATLGRIWQGGVHVDWARLVEGERRRRVALPTYPFEGQRYWIEPGKGATARAVPTSSGALTKRPDVSSWFYAPTWQTTAPPHAIAGSEETRWLVFLDDVGVGERLIPRLPGKVTVVERGKRFLRLGDGRYALRPAEPADYVSLVNDLALSSALPERVVHLWSVTPPLPAWARLIPGRELGAIDAQLVDYYLSQILLVQALSREIEAVEWITVSNHLHSIAGETELSPEKALLMGPVRVIPREWPRFLTRSVDIEVLPSGSWPQGSWKNERAIEQLAREVTTSSDDTVVAYRGAERFAQVIQPVKVPPRPASRDWLRPGTVVLVTGGLGGIGLEVAAHLARVGRARLVLVGRTPVPPRATWDSFLASHPKDDPTSVRIEKLRALEALGAEVVVESADVTDLEAMRGIVSRATSRFGRIDGVVHSAGVLKDALIGTRGTEVRSPVLDTKVRGALVLEQLLGGSSLDFFVVFSSVSSLLGLPGQVDYTAANAFLDAFARARATRSEGRTAAIDWNAWQEVGMAVDLARAAKEPGGSQPRAADLGGAGAVTPGGHPLLEQCLRDTKEETVFSTQLSRDKHWVAGEHVVRGADALIPGTGLVEIVRAALAFHPEPRPIELRELVFLSPVVVPATGHKELHVRVRHGSAAEITLYGESEATPHVTGIAAYVDVPRPARVDVPAIFARCNERIEEPGGFPVQSFMDFGPRWGNIMRLRFGHGEATAELELPAAHEGDLPVYALHPALLDMATGAAQSLIPGFDAARDFYVPFSYGKVVAFAPLETRLVSHVRYRSGGARNSAVFDVTLMTPDGTVLAEIAAFSMRKVSDRVAGQSTVWSDSAAARSSDGNSAPTSRRAPSPLEAALRQGILPAEGMEAFDRILGASGLSQVVASSVDMVAWVDIVRAEAQSSAAPTSDTSAEGPQFTRPSLSTSYIAPRTTVEQGLAVMWRELLGVSEVGVNDDFFELGGQSLIAVRLFNKVRKRYGVELPLSTLFEAPTIAGCAALLQAELGTPTELLAVGAEATPAAPEAADLPRANARLTFPDGRPLRHVVTIQRGSQRTPFFCVHGAGGNVLNFRDMANLFDREQPFYGLQARGVDGVLRPHESVEAMARAYLEEVRVVQPHGPYLLGGYSGGGLVAFEMAQLLTAVGEEVGLLAFIDTFYPGMRPIERGISERWQRLSRAGAGAFIRSSMETQRRHAGYRVQSFRIARHVRNGEQIPTELRDYHLTASFEALSREYRPRPWSGRATLFRAEELLDVFEATTECYGWSEVVNGGVQVVRVPGNHDTLLLGSNAKVLLTAFRRALAEQERPRPGGKPEREGLLANPGQPAL